MNKVEHANKLYKLNHDRKKNIKRAEIAGKEFEVKKDSITMASKDVSSNEPQVSKKSPDIRIDMVNKFKKDISKGIYEVKTNEIAEKIIQKYKEQTYYKSYS